MLVSILDADPLWTHRGGVAVVVGALIVAELIYVAAVKGKAPAVRTTLTDCTIFAVNLGERALTLGVRLALFGGLSSLAPFHWDASLASALVGYVLVDFVYYWKHRFFHRTRIGWALHSTHHSSRSLNFLAAFRLNWIEAAVGYLFFAPLALLGFDPLLLLLLVEVNDGWQFVCHTELVNPFRFLDAWVNTPNIHRVHHARDPSLHGRNFGSTFMLWDRMFGTYHPGLSSVVYGVADLPPHANVLELQFGPLLRLFARPRAAGAAPSENNIAGLKSAVRPGSAVRRGTSQ